MIKKLFLVLLILAAVFVSGCTSPLQEVDKPLNSQESIPEMPPPPPMPTGMVVGSYIQD